MSDVLVLYPEPARERQALVRAHRPMLDALGVRLVLADDEPEDGDRECFARVIELPPPERVTEGWHALRGALVHAPVDAVLAQSEDGLLLGALAAREFALPALPVEAALATASKVHTRRALAAHGVAQPRFALGTCAADVLRFASSSGFPLVLKAASSVRSKLVTLVERSEDVSHAVERLVAALPHSQHVRRIVDFARATGSELGFDAEREFLIEEFARGAPVETDGLLYGTRPFPFGVIEQVLTPPPRFYLEGYLLPADRPRAELDAIERESAAALAAVGLANAGYSIELRWDGVRARVIEVNGRLGWDEGFGDLFELVIGAHPAALALQVALGVEPRFERTAAVHAAIAYRSAFVDGVVSGVPSAAELEAARHGVERLEVVARIGRRLHAPPHPDVEPHLAHAIATDARSSRSAHARARGAVERLQFEIVDAAADEGSTDELRGGSRDGPRR
ncbi:MAG: hypothetical protein HZA53_06560 [Planctomycetes bacterium]|nr:hypothetical protein [Planctomycetota bacterium]